MFTTLRSNGAAAVDFMSRHKVGLAASGALFGAAAAVGLLYPMPGKAGSREFNRSLKSHLDRQGIPTR